MLSQRNRLTKNKDFDLVFKKGRSYYQPLFGIKILQKNNNRFNRFGILLSTKVSKKAVERNLYKRRIKAILNLEKPKLKVGYDCVIVVFPVILGKSFQDIQTGIRGSFVKLNFYDQLVR
jgi:ribonuclease P protein component